MDIAACVTAHSMKDPQSNAAPSPEIQADAVCRWDGHMSDGIGHTYGLTPMASLSANADELLLSGSRGTFRISRSLVTKLGRGKFYPWFFGAVRIHHDIPGYPDELQFKPTGASLSEVRSRLQALGYPSA